MRSPSTLGDVRGWDWTGLSGAPLSAESWEPTFYRSGQCGCGEGQATGRRGSGQTRQGASQSWRAASTRPEGAFWVEACLEPALSCSTSVPQVSTSGCRWDGPAGFMVQTGCDREVALYAVAGLRKRGKPDQARNPGLTAWERSQETVRLPVPPHTSSPGRSWYPPSSEHPQVPRLQAPRSGTSSSLQAWHLLRPCASLPVPWEGWGWRLAGSWPVSPVTLSSAKRGQKPPVALLGIAPGDEGLVRSCV